VSYQIPPPQAQKPMAKTSLGSGIAFERLGGHAARGSLTEHDVRVPRRTNELDAEALRVVIRGENVNHLDIASVAAAAIAVVNPQGSPADRNFLFLSVGKFGPSIPLHTP
jgi:hypothetical protein